MLKEKDEKFTEEGLKISPMLHSKAFTSAQAHDSLLCAASVKESKQREIQASVRIQKHRLSVSSETSASLCSALIPGNIKPRLRCILLLTHFNLFDPPPHAVCTHTDQLSGIKKEDEGVYSEDGDSYSSVRQFKTILGL